MPFQCCSSCTFVTLVISGWLLYGSLGTLVIPMFWFYLSGAAILVGGEINAVLEDTAAKHKVRGAKKRGQRSL